MRIERIKSSFDTLILDRSDNGLSIEEATEYDDQVGEGGEIDIGEIASQYLSLEIGL
jgi:hypothetical protein